MYHFRAISESAALFAQPLVRKRLSVPQGTYVECAHVQAIASSPRPSRVILRHAAPTKHCVVRQHSLPAFVPLQPFALLVAIHIPRARRFERVHPGSTVSLVPATSPTTAFRHSKLSRGEQYLLSVPVRGSQSPFLTLLLLRFTTCPARTNITTISTDN